MPGLRLDGSPHRGRTGRPAGRSGEGRAGGGSEGPRAEGVTVAVGADGRGAKTPVSCGPSAKPESPRLEFDSQI